MRTCKQCRGVYTPSKSLSSLRLTYCGVMCEAADLGFHLASFERFERTRFDTVRPIVVQCPSVRHQRE